MRTPDGKLITWRVRHYDTGWSVFCRAGRRGDAGVPWHAIVCGQRSLEQARRAALASMLSRGPGWARR